MSGDNFTENVSKKRFVLGDVTNLPVKRAFSSISDDLGLKSTDGYGENFIFEKNSNFAKQVCIRDENFVKEKNNCKTTKPGGEISNSNEKGMFVMEDKQSCESSDCDTDTDLDNSHEINENKDASNLLGGSGNFLKNVGETGEASRDSCASTGSMSSKKDSDDDEGRLSLDVRQSHSSGGHGCTSVVDKDVSIVGKLAGSKCGEVERSKFIKSQGGSRSFEFDRCAALKDDGCANLSAGANLLKACSCSFCLTAAYMWADLHYQDIKGRIAALKKSQKEASILVNKYERGKQTDIHNPGNSSKSSQLESDLTAQWRSLFHHMEDIFVHESNQLQAGFVALKDLRENCKVDLEKTNGPPPDKF